MIKVQKDTVGFAAGGECGGKTSIA